MQVETLEKLRQFVAHLRDPQVIEANSSALSRFSYNRAKLALEVEFKKGDHYVYGSVPPQVYKDLLDAESKGRYFVSHIRNDFPMRRLEETEYSF